MMLIKCTVTYPSSTGFPPNPAVDSRHPSDDNIINKQIRSSPLSKHKMSMSSLTKS